MLEVVTRMRSVVVVALVACGSGGSNPVCTDTADASGACPESVCSYCAVAGSDFGCPMTWTAAHHRDSWNCKYITVDLVDCGDAKIAYTFGVDTGTTLFYDASGMLYRINNAGMFGNGCLAGSGSAAMCDPSTPRTQVCP